MTPIKRSIKNNFLKTCVRFGRNCKSKMTIKLLKRSKKPILDGILMCAGAHTRACSKEGRNLLIIWLVDGQTICEATAIK